MAELVHRPEQPAEVLGEIARRDADVRDAGAGGERVHRRVEPPHVVGEAEGANDLELEHLLRLEVEVVCRRALRISRRDFLDERGLVLLQVVEDVPDLLRGHVALVVVEHDVVRLVHDLEAVDVPLAQVEVLPQDRQEAREVVVLARLHPHRIRERRRPRHLGAQVG